MKLKCEKITSSTWIITNKTVMLVFLWWILFAIQWYTLAEYFHLRYLWFMYCRHTLHILLDAYLAMYTETVTISFFLQSKRTVLSWITDNKGVEQCWQKTYLWQKSNLVILISMSFILWMQILFIRYKTAVLFQ